jgi:hypothetical protein
MIRMGDTTVRFLESGAGSLALLEIETPTGFGLFARVVEALYALGVQVARAESRVRNELCVERLYLVEQDGGSILPSRRLEIQVDVLRAVGALSSPRSPASLRAIARSRSPGCPSATSGSAIPASAGRRQTEPAWLLRIPAGLRPSPS